MLVVKDRGYDIYVIGIFDCKVVMNVLDVDSKCYVLLMLFVIGKVVIVFILSVCLLLEYIVLWNDGKGFKK